MTLRQSKPTKAQILAAMRAQAIGPDALARGDARMRVGAPEPAKPATSKPPAKLQENPGASESEVLRSVMAYLHHHPAVAFAFRANTGAVVDDRGQYIRFGFPGQPDIMGCMKGGQALYIEVKRENGGVLSDKQKAFLTRAKEAGALVGVVRSIDECERLLATRSAHKTMGDA